MNRQQRKNFIKGMNIKERLSIAVTMPPKEKPIVKEYNIGRNDKCPCDKNKDAMNAFAEWSNAMILWGPKNGAQCPEYKALKYKDCCMKSGKYENYKTNE